MILPKRSKRARFSHVFASFYKSCQFNHGNQVLSYFTKTYICPFITHKLLGSTCIWTNRVLVLLSLEENSFHKMNLNPDFRCDSETLR